MSQAGWKAHARCFSFDTTRPLHDHDAQKKSGVRTGRRPSIPHPAPRELA